MKYKIPFIRPNFPDANDMALDYAQILAANWFTNFGPFERRFAKQIGKYIGDGYYAATFSSATAGLIAVLLAILGKGDGTQYVLMPSFTFAAGADALIWCGFKPLFLDIEPVGLQMNIKHAQEALSEPKYNGKIAAILFCNAFGVGTTNIQKWEQLSESTKIPLIIDSAAGFGSTYDGQKKLGEAGLCEIFSFHATKPFAIGEGGAVVSRDEELIHTLEQIQNFGFDDTRSATGLGFNGKLQELNAAIGLRQMKRFNQVLYSRKLALDRYKKLLNPDRFRLQENAKNASLCFVAVIVQEAEKRDEYLEKLRESGIEAKMYYSPSLHKQAYFKDQEIFLELNITNHIDDSIISLPVHDDMAEKDIRLIAEVLNQA